MNWILCERNPGVSEKNYNADANVVKLWTEIWKQGFQNARQECSPLDQNVQIILLEHCHEWLAT